MATSTVITVNDSTPTLVTPIGTHSGIDLTIQNTDNTNHVYVGGPNVTSTNYGFLLEKGKAVAFTIPSTESLYVLGSVSSQNIAVLQLALN